MINDNDIPPCWQADWLNCRIDESEGGGGMSGDYEEKHSQDTRRIG